MADFLTAFKNMIVDVTVKRQTIIDPLAARKESTSQTFIIKGVILPAKEKNNGSTTLIITKEHGTYNLGDIIVYTLEELQCGNDIILFDGKEYGALTQIKYTSIIPHNRYLCSGNI